ncbi:hypothetical protein PanWU01x14_110580 [Parasponia andersonii]|uniref:Uncharacterized protein n=1 Tax=Parasponia andersonii TaxID=3476 RepID=A0A2P5CZD9_PARAD|nr:hypothetical protein PanWU01x14_110580 [Parasponia andersonii]
MGKFYSAVCASCCHQITGDSWQESRQNPSDAVNRGPNPSGAHLDSQTLCGVGSGSFKRRGTILYLPQRVVCSATSRQAHNTTRLSLSLSLSPFSNFSGNFHGHFPADTHRR